MEIEFENLQISAEQNTDQLLYRTSTTYNEFRPNLYSPTPLFLELRQFGQPVKQKG